MGLRHVNTVYEVTYFNLTATVFDGFVKMCVI